MAMKLATTIGRSKTYRILWIKKQLEFLEYTKNNGSSENHQNNNLEVIIAFGNFLEGNSFMILKKELPRREIRRQIKPNGSRTQ